MNLGSEDQHRDGLPLEQLAHSLHADELIINLCGLTHALSCQKFKKGAFHKELIHLYFMLLRIFLRSLSVLHFGLDFCKMLSLYFPEYLDSLSVTF